MDIGIAQLGISGGSQLVQHLPDAGEVAVTDFLVLCGKMVEVVGAKHLGSFPEVSAARNPDGRREMCENCAIESWGNMWYTKNALGEHGCPSVCCNKRV